MAVGGNPVILAVAFQNLLLTENALQAKNKEFLTSPKRLPKNAVV
jgi:hypothetical protein